jgi:signal transduction histidine kinase
MRGVSFETLVPESNLDTLLDDFRDRRKRVMEISLPPRERSRTAQTLTITAVRLARLGALGRSKRIGGKPAGAQEFRLLLLEDVTDRALLEQHLVETEKQAAVGQLAAGILHEVSNPLASLGSNLLFVRDTLADSHAPELVEALDASLDHLEQMRQILGTLSSFPRRPAPRFEIADVIEIVQRSVRFVSREAERRHIAFSTVFSSPMLACEMDVRLMKQVLLNLLKNALEATPENGRIEVRTFYRARHRHEPSSVVIEIADDGIGITESDLRNVFRPLFSTKPRGTGLGLSFCRQTVEEHGGEIRLTSPGRNQGTVAIVTLPVRQVTADVE